MAKKSVIAKPSRVIDGIEICEANRFSVHVKGRAGKDSMLLEKWREWFISRGIPAVIACDDSGWAVYRQNLIPIEIDYPAKKKAA